MDAFYIASFWCCSTMRNYQYGYIPWNRIREYGYTVGLDGDTIEAFVIVIRAMDEGYLGWLLDQAEKRKGQDKPTDEPVVVERPRRRSRRNG